MIVRPSGTEPKVKCYLEVVVPVEPGEPVKEAVAAARISGAGDLAILYREIAPNVMPIALLNIAISMAWAIITEASIGFLGFGDPEDTIGYLGCALTSVAMLLSGHGYAETPKTLNQKLKNVQGFVSAAIRWGAVSQVYPNVRVKSNISCTGTPAPLELIDAAIAAGQPAIVQVDNSPAAGIQTHWVVLYQKQGEDYLVLDPWPYPPERGQEVLLMPRYSQGKPLPKSISAVVFYECLQEGAGHASEPGGTEPALPVEPGTYVRVPVTVEAGLRLGVLWDLQLRATKRDRRDLSVHGLSQKFHIDAGRASRVADIAAHLFKQLKPETDGYAPYLRWSALLHELGMGFAKAGLSVRSAHIATYAGQTLDTFYLTEFGGRLLTPAKVAQRTVPTRSVCSPGVAMRRTLG